MKKNKVKKKRADILLLEKELVSSKEEAQKYIMAGKVRIGSDHIIQKTSDLFAETADISIDTPKQFVSRGAYKLLPALEKYTPSLDNKITMDIGASTGGFTDLMLQKGAVKIYAIDCGTNQLHHKLRTDKRVICHEKTNAKNLESDFISEKVNVITMDVSFISVTQILPAVTQFLEQDGICFILIKPQFEAERKDVPKGGVVIDKNIHNKCIQKVAEFATNKLNLKILETIPSPICGPKGNQEYIMVMINN